jgi:Fic family protein
VNTAKTLVKMFADDRQKIQSTGKSAGSALRVHHAQSPVASTAKISQMAGLSVPAAAASLNVLSKLGIARELTDRKRGRVFGYDQYIKTLSKGTEPI